MKKNEYQCPICFLWFKGDSKVMLDFPMKDCMHGEDQEIKQPDEI